MVFLVQKAERPKETGTPSDINVLELMTIVKALEVLKVTDQTLVVWSDNQVEINVILRLWVALS